MTFLLIFYKNLISRKMKYYSTSFLALTTFYNLDLRNLNYKNLILISLRTILFIYIIHYGKLS